MDPDSIVAMLEPLRQPAAVGWWPPAPGWWLLAAALLGLLGWLLYRQWCRHRRGAPLRAARRELNELAQRLIEGPQTVLAVMTLLRRVAYAVDPAGANAHAAQTGNAWFDYLNGLAADEEPRLGGELAALAYQPTVDDDSVSALLKASDQWLRMLERQR